MKIKLRKYVDFLFWGYENQRPADELKEEILSNCYAHYDDLISQGFSEQEAYQSVVAGIGDVEELLQEMGCVKRILSFDRENMEKPGVSADLNQTEAERLVVPERDRRARKRFAVLIALGLIFLLSSPIWVLIDLPIEYGVSILLACAAIGIAIMAYAGINYGTKLSAPKEDLVSDFRDYRDRKKMVRQSRNSIRSAIWSLIVAAYFLISFTTGRWAITWIIFIVGGALSDTVSLWLDSYFERRYYRQSSDGITATEQEIQGRRNLRRSLYSLIDALAWIAFLYFGFWHGLWFISWIAFVIASAVKNLLRVALNL